MRGIGLLSLLKSDIIMWVSLFSFRSRSLSWMRDSKTWRSVSCADAASAAAAAAAAAAAVAAAAVAAAAQTALIVVVTVAALAAELAASIDAATAGAKSPALAHAPQRQRHQTAVSTIVTIYPHRSLAVTASVGLACLFSHCHVESFFARAWSAEQ